jgi:hypothetical protein
MSRQRKSETILEFYRRAAARRFAADSRDPAERADLLEVARGWQRLSHGDAFEDESHPTEVVSASRRLANRFCAAVNVLRSWSETSTRISTERPLFMKSLGMRLAPAVDGGNPDERLLNRPWARRRC